MKLPRYYRVCCFEIRAIALQLLLVGLSLLSCASSGGKTTDGSMTYLASDGKRYTQPAEKQTSAIVETTPNKPSQNLLSPEDQMFYSVYFKTKLLAADRRYLEAYELLQPFLSKKNCPPRFFMTQAELSLRLTAMTTTDTTNTTQTLPKPNLKKTLNLINQGLKLYPQNPELLRMRASVLFEQGDVEGAIAELESILTQSPKYAPALEKIAEIRLLLFSRAGTLDELMTQRQGLIDAYERLLPLRQRHTKTPILLMLSSLYLSVGNPQLALERAKSALEEDRHQPQVFLVLGASYEASGDIPNAILAYRSALDLDPQNAKALGKLESLLEQTKNMDSLLQFYSQRAEQNPDDLSAQTLYLTFLLRESRWDELDAALDKTIARWPDIKEFYQIQTLSAMERGRFEEIFSVLDSLDGHINETAESDSVTSETRKQTFLEIKDAVAETALGSLDPYLQDDLTTQTTNSVSKDAIIDFVREFSNRFPDKESISLLLLDLLFSNGREPEATALLESLYKKHPNSEKYSLLLAQRRILQNRLDDATTLLDAIPKASHPALEIMALQLRFAITVSKKDWPKAIEIGQEIITREPDSVRNRLELGYIYQETGDFESAETLYLQALSLDPEDPEVNNSLAYFYAETDQNLDDALVLAQKALALSPEAAHIEDTIGWVLHKLGRNQEALPYLERASKKMATGPDAVVYEHLGEVYYQLKRLDEAKAVWKKALEIDPNAIQDPEKRAIIGK